jgi:tetratricopeptide (TPR) repeat protein
MTPSESTDVDNGRKKYIRKSVPSSNSITQKTPTQSTIDNRTAPDNDDDSDGGDDLEAEVITSSLKIADAEFDKGNYEAAELWYGKASDLTQRLSVDTRNKLGLADLGLTSSLKLADAVFDKHNYEAAELGYRNALGLAQHLSSDRPAELTLRDLADISMKIAICCFRLQQFPESEAVLQDIQNSPFISKNSIRLWDAIYLQAEIHLSTDHMNLAEKECKKALAGRRKAMGKQHRSYLEAVALLSIILEAKGDDTSARMYGEMVETSVLESLRSSADNKTNETPQERTVSGLRGISPIDVLLGVREIKEKLVKSREGPFDITELLYQAVEEGLESAVQLLLTGCSPNSYIPFISQLRLENRNPDQPFIPQFSFEYQDPSQLHPKPANPWNMGVPKFPEHGVLLHVAAIQGHLGVTKLLLDNGFDVNAQDSKGATPLHYLFHTPLDTQPRIKNVNVEVVKLLLMRGASGQIADLSGQIPEMYHPLNGADSIKTYHSFIVEQGLNSPEYQQQREANTWRAIDLGSRDVFELLLDSGVSLHLKDRNGSTISGLAYRNATKAQKYKVGDPDGVHKLLVSRIEKEEMAAFLKKEAEKRAAKEAARGAK